MHPWWRGFTGEVLNTAKNKYEIKGTVTKVDDTTVEITELPIYKWTSQFKVELDAMMEKGDIIKVRWLALVAGLRSCSLSAELPRASRKRQRPFRHPDVAEGDGAG